MLVKRLVEIVFDVSCEVMLLLGLDHFIASASEFFKVLGIVVGSLRCFRERFSAVFAFACKCFSYILG